MPQQLTITLNDDSTVSLQGPISNKILCYGMLKIAEEAVQDYHREQQKRVKVAGVEDLNKIAGIVGGN